tara:strand:- start:15085 stop:16248 length:1164 start_codon:yes stop_codon:yes gene_type:complete
MKNIFIVTGSRAEYGLLKYLIREFRQDLSINFKLIVTGSHLMKNYGATFNEILSDSNKIDKKIFLRLKSDKKYDIAKVTGEAIYKFSNYFNKNKCDLLIVLGDRYEIFAATIAAYFMNIKIAHFHGGEITKGAIDEGIRHSITKMSNYHFVSTEIYKKRVIQLGENRKNVFNVGAISLDNILKTKLLNKKNLEKEIKFKFKQINILFTYHPVTLERYTAKKQIKKILEALKYFNSYGIIFTLPNADPDNNIISVALTEFVKDNSDRCILYKSLGSLKYFSCLKYVDIVIGNSSSGIIEVPNFNIPTINIGDRQKGRISSKSVINVKCDKNEIINSIKESLTLSFKQKIKKSNNPYFKKNTIKKSFKIIKNLDLSKNIKKNFNDIKIK